MPACAVFPPSLFLRQWTALETAARSIVQFPLRPFRDGTAEPTATFRAVETLRGDGTFSEFDLPEGALLLRLIDRILDIGREVDCARCTDANAGSACWLLASIVGPVGDEDTMFVVHRQVVARPAKATRRRRRSCGCYGEISGC
jgi:hypothetical protein